MTFDLTTWKQSTADRLRGLGAWLKERQQDAPYAAYGALCGMSLWQLVEAARRGQTLDVMVALGAVAGGVGGNLVANQIQAWKDRADAGADASGPAAAAEWVAHNAPRDADLRAALDAILEKLEAIAVAKAALGQSEREQFERVLREELGRLGNLPRFEALLRGGGAIAQGDGATAVGERGAYVESMPDGILVTGDKNQVQKAAVIFNLIAQITQPNEDAAQARELIAAYLSALIMDCSGLKLSAIDQGAARPGRHPWNWPMCMST